MQDLKKFAAHKSFSEKDTGGYTPQKQWNNVQRGRFENY